MLIVSSLFHCVTSLFYYGDCLWLVLQLSEHRSAMLPAEIIFAATASREEDRRYELVFDGAKVSFLHGFFAALLIW
jgi:hypothetical protein